MNKSAIIASSTVNAQLTYPVTINGVQATIGGVDAERVGAFENLNNGIFGRKFVGGGMIVEVDCDTLNVNGFFTFGLQSGVNSYSYTWDNGVSGYVHNAEGVNTLKAPTSGIHNLHIAHFDNEVFTGFKMADANDRNSLTEVITYNGIVFKGVSRMFQGTRSLTCLPDEPLLSVSGYGLWFAGRSVVVCPHLEHFDMSVVTNLKYGFYFNSLLTVLGAGLGESDTLTSLEICFKDCRNILAGEFDWLVGKHYKNLINIADAFSNVGNCNIDISDFQISNLTSASNVMYGTATTPETLARIYDKWGAWAIANGANQSVPFGAYPTKYAVEGAIGRAILVDQYNWTVHDGGSETTADLNEPPNTVNITFLI